MTTKRKLILSVVAVLATLLTLCVLMSACGETMYKITWDYDEAQVSVEMVEGGTLPTELEAEKEYVFKVTAKTGFTVKAVRATNGKITDNKDGTYKLVVTKDEAKVTITSDRVLSDLTVTTTAAQTDTAYYAGDTFDTTGMVVEATYANGDKEMITNYSILPATFEGEETEVTVSFGGVSKTIQLKQAVEYLVTIDPTGGTIDASSDVFGWGSASYIHDYSVDAATGVISFSYLTLGEGVSLTLPAASAMSKGEVEGDFTFKDWAVFDGDNTYTSVTKITDETKASLDIEARWNPRLVNLTSINLENRLEDGAVIPALVLKGSFAAAEEVYIYLYEGNAKVEVKDEDAAQSGQRDDEFELVFDLTKINDSAYTGKWMDIRVNAVIEGREESMEVVIEDYAEDFVDTTVQITDAELKNTYNYQTYAAEIDKNKTALKIQRVSGVTFANVYQATAAIDGNTMTVNGTLPMALMDKTAVLTLHQDAVTGDNAKPAVDLKSHATVGADGKFTVTFDVSTVDFLSDATVGIAVYNEAFADITDATSPVVSDSKGLASYFATGSFTSVAFAEKNNKPYVVLTGSYANLSNDVAASVLGNLVTYVDIMQGGGSWNSAVLTKGDETNDWFIEAADGTYRVYLSIAFAQGGVEYFFHYGDGNTNLGRPATVDNTPLTLNGKTYTFVNTISGQTSWTGSLVNVHVENVDKMTMTGVTLEESEGKAYYVVSGTYEGSVTEADVSAIYLEVNNVNKAETFTVSLDTTAKTFEVRLDVTDVEATGELLYPHWTVKGTTSGIADSTHAHNGRTLTVNGKLYTLVNGGSTAGDDGTPATWDNICLKVTTAA